MTFWLFIENGWGRGHELHASAPTVDELRKKALEDIEGWRDDGDAIKHQHGDGTFFIERFVVVDQQGEETDNALFITEAPR